MTQKPRDGLKTIAVSEANYDKLLMMGRMCDSFNDVVTRLLNEHEEDRTDENSK